MSPDNSDHDLLLAVHTTVKRMDTELFGGEGREGRLPKLEDRQDEQQGQINFWRGALAFVGLLVLAFGGWLAEHILTAH